MEVPPPKKVASSVDIDVGGRVGQAFVYTVLPAPHGHLFSLPGEKKRSNLISVASVINNGDFLAR